MVWSCECGGLTKNFSELNDVMKELVCPRCGSKLKEEVRVRQTSLDSFFMLDESELSRMRKLVYDALLVKPMTDRELTVQLGFKERNVVSPRRNELVEMGLVKPNCKRVCTVSTSGKKVIEWMVV